MQDKSIDCFDQLPVGVIVYSDLGNELYSNPAARSIWYGTHAVSVGESSEFQARRTSGQLVLPEDWPHRKCIRERRAVGAQLIQVEFKDGIHKTLLCSASPSLDGGIVAIFQDLTQMGGESLFSQQVSPRMVFLTQTSKLLSESLDYEKTLLKVAESAVPAVADWCILDITGADSKWRRAAVFHRDKSKQKLARELEEAFPPSADSRGVPSQVLRSGQPLLIPSVTEAHYEATARSSRHLEILKALGSGSYMCVPVMARDKMVGALTLVNAQARGAYHDIDLAFALDLCARAGMALENARLYSEARQAVQAREDVLAIVSHDLKNPLTTIKLVSQYIPALLTKPNAENLIRRQSDLISNAVLRMERLISDLLDLSKIEAGRLSLERQESRVGLILEEAVFLFEPIASAQGMKIGIEIAEEARNARFDCDRGRILQVLSNLLGNSLKFSPLDSKVILGADTFDDGIVFSVKDFGSGISEDHLPRLFDRYWQAREHASKGSGLGLSIAKGIVEAHEGRIWVESSLGQGSTFRFSLPFRARNADTRKSA